MLRGVLIKEYSVPNFLTYSNQIMFAKGLCSDIALGGYHNLGILNFRHFHITL